MIALPLTKAEEEAFELALVDSKRRVRIRGQLFNRFDNPLAEPVVIIDGEVVVDNTDPTRPARTALVNFSDPDRRISIDATDVGTGGLILSKSIQLWYGVFVRSLDRWVDVPIFYGPILEASRSGSEVELDCAGKEVQHLPPHNFFSSHSEGRGTRIHIAIRRILANRGETKFRLGATPFRRLQRARTWGPAGVPWRACRNLASSVDRQLFYQGDGFVRLRQWPDTPAWRFTEGKDAIVLDDAEERFSIHRVVNAVLVRGERTVKVQVRTEAQTSKAFPAGSDEIRIERPGGGRLKNFQAGRKIEIGRGANMEVRTIAGDYTPGTLRIPLLKALDTRKVKGAPVVVRHREDRARPVIGRARVPAGHPVSDTFLTGGGGRPRVRIENRPGISKVAQARRVANRILDRIRLGVEHEIGLRTVVVPHLEEGDVVRADADTIAKRFRLRRFTIPLHPSGSMDINWTGRRVPQRRQR